MRARGIVLALGGAREFGDALLEDGVASRFALECGARPLVYHALRAIARASRYACEKITVVCEGDAHAAIVRECASAWALEWGTTPTIEVTAVDEGAGGGDALAAATRDDEAAEMKDTALIVVNGDVVMDVDVDDVVSAHFVREATATCVLAKRRAWGEVERKAGRAPKGMRYVGLSADEGTVAFLSGGKEDEAKKRLKLHRSALNNNGEMVIRTDLTDVGAYVLDGAETLRALRETPHLKSVRLDLVPHFVEEQFRGTTKGRVAAYIVKDDKYCVAVDSAKPALLETSKDIASEFHHLNEKPLSKYDNVVDPSVEIGAKSTIGPGCAVAARCTFKDKCSVKKSVIAAECQFGSAVKISNSLILRGARRRQHAAAPPHRRGVRRRRRVAAPRPRAAATSRPPPPRAAPPPRTAFACRRCDARRPALGAPPLRRGGLRRCRAPPSRLLGEANPRRVAPLPACLA